MNKNTFSAKYVKNIRLKLYFLNYFLVDTSRLSTYSGKKHHRDETNTHNTTEEQNMTQQELGARLRRFRKSYLHATQRNVAQRCNVAQGTISHWENGTMCPELLSLLAYSKAFNVTLHTLLGMQKRPRQDLMSFILDEKIPVSIKKGRKQVRLRST